MRKLSAHYIYDGNGRRYEKGILTIDNDGTVINIHDTHGHLEEPHSVEFYSGVLTPGFINAHCHLELSHLYEFFSPQNGLPDFLKEVVSKRADSPDRIRSAAEIADLTMWHNGIIAVGDISNTFETFDVKKKSKIFYHTFVEVLGFEPSKTEKSKERAITCFEKAQQYHLTASIAPHSPYGTSAELLKWIAFIAKEDKSILTLHNQETPGEDELFRTGKGKIANHLSRNLFLDLSHFQPTGKSALSSILRIIPVDNPLLMVHNIYTSEQDLDFFFSVRKNKNSWFVICPGSNLFVEERLPDLELFKRKKLHICLGTDSLASNWHLSLLEEMKIIQQYYDNITLSEMITWATVNGAKALRIDSWAGSFEIGKRPGVNLISNLDIKSGMLKSDSKIKRLI